MARTFTTLVQEVREILRAEGVDGGGYSDFLIEKSVNKGIADLAEIYPVRDTITFNAVADQEEYDLSSITYAPYGLTDIIRATYDGNLLTGIDLDAYYDIEDPTDGDVDYWMLWGKKFTLIGDVEVKAVKLWITRPPKELANAADVPEIPPIADMAVVQFAVASCFQESRDLDQYSAAEAKYQHLKEQLSLHGSPRGQRDHLQMVRDSYWGPVKSSGYTKASDTDPHPEGGAD